MQAQASSFFAGPDAATHEDLINDHRADETPTSARLIALIEARRCAAGIDIPYR
jgi:hypothetical protein